MNIAKQVMLRTGQFADADDAAAFEVNYTAILATGVAGVDIPLSALRNSVLASEKRLATLIGLSENDLWRNALKGRTVDIASGADVPTSSNGTFEFVGAFGNIRDSANNTKLTEKPIEEINRLNRLFTAGVLQIKPYHFHLASGVLFHTRTNAYMEGCVWDLATRLTAYNALGNSPLPQGFENFWIADVLVNQPQEGWFIQEAGHYAGIVSGGEAMIQQGVIPQIELPDTTASVAPDKN